MAPASLKTLIDDLLDQQSQLQTPVNDFSNYFDQSPDLQSHYQKLIPLSKPGPGEQYAFEVALDRCTGCKACVSACHSMNGLDADESWRDVGLLLGGEESPQWQQTVTSACHHCESPECLHGCPVRAYEKNPDTGIVKHLDDQCIGCSYCILKCPFDVPKYSKKRGIVRKCDMCQSRLADGEAPACVQACPTEAIRIITISRQQRVNEVTRGIDFLPGSPSPSITQPTTKYIGRIVPVSAFQADQNALRKEHHHWPLAIMLSCTQVGLGLVCAFSLGLSSISLLMAGIIIFFIGMTASIFHLGRPLGAWRFFLGLKTSWLSREILAFSLVAPLVLSCGVVAFFPTLGNYLPPHVLSSAMTAISLIAIFTSVMIYVDTKRECWSLPISSWRFYSSFMLGFFLFHPIILFACVFVKMAVELAFLKKHNAQHSWSPLRHLARVTWHTERALFITRIATLVTSLVACCYSPIGAISLLFMSEIAERALFFSTVYAPKMTSRWN